MARRPQRGAQGRPEQEIFAALRQFAEQVTEKFEALANGAPEDQLRAPFEVLLRSAGQAIGVTVVPKGESQLADRLGRPDYAVVSAGLLAGYVELKEPGKGVTRSSFRGHDSRQFDRFKAIPNLIYSDGNNFALYRSGERIGRIVRISGDIKEDGANAVVEADAISFLNLLREFLSWEPIVPQNAKALAALLAPICRMLRNEVTDALENPTSPLHELYRQWQRLLFPDADHAKFADAYAQTVTFALLLARSEGADTNDENLTEPINQLSADHALLSRALQILVDSNVRDEISPPLRLLQRVIGRVPQDALGSSDEGDPWLYFYEDFLAEYDPNLRRDAGAYYTPVEVVRAQVRLVDRLLKENLNRPLGYADPTVITLDPAVGTGTYLLGVIDHVKAQITGPEGEGEGAVADRLTALGRRLYGFENMVGPYAVAQLRISRALMDHDASLPEDGPGIFLTDTLESPHAEPPQGIMGFAQRELAEQHQRAQVVKDRRPVLVCLGNPPYDRDPRVNAGDAANRARTGSWVRWGDSEDGSNAIFRSFLQPALDAGFGSLVRNLYNLYIYFWRWALWKVFEHTSSTGPGVVSFITASAYMTGEAYVGMREEMRRMCDEIWIIDIGGEGRGGRRSPNVFSIQTPVSIAVAARYGQARPDTPATVRYARVDGTRTEKLRALDSIRELGGLSWRECPTDWQAPFMPRDDAEHARWPALSDILPWSARGIQFSRTWPVCADQPSVVERWRTLMRAEPNNRAAMVHETRDVEVDRGYPSFLSANRLPCIRSLGRRAEPDSIEAVCFRSFDRQWCIADRRVIDMPRPPLWRSRSDSQVFLITAAGELSVGPALSATIFVPDLNAFNNRGGLTFPIYRQAGTAEPNILPGLLDLLEAHYGRVVTPDDLCAYIYGVAAHPLFTRRFHVELEARELRIPLTQDARLFEEVAEIGRELLWLHTGGQRFTNGQRRRGQIPRGSARCTQRVQGPRDPYPDGFEYSADECRIAVGRGFFAPVTPEVYQFEVSGLQIVRSWLSFRMAEPRGRRTPPLDEVRPTRWTDQFTTELLELLWVLEKTVEVYPRQAELLEEVLAGELFQADELPEVPPAMRRAPSARGPSLFE